MRASVINLQPGMGGAEVYTRFFVRALLDLDCEVRLYVRPGETHWATLAHPRLQIEAAVDSDALIARLPAQREWIVTHAPVSQHFAEHARAHHLLTGFCHMPLAGRQPGVLAAYDRVYGVSDYVIATARAAGLINLDPEPCYGMVDFQRYAGAADARVLPGPVYSWDRRKFRDRAYGLLEGALRPLLGGLSPPAPYVKRAGLTLGIVSGIGPIKQFDVLFRHIAPVLAAEPDVCLEVFGWGGYRSVADLRAALRPLGSRVRFWGLQAHPEHIYPQLDYLMSGLPEKEALGLNILEAQSLGTPVLAVAAPPFTETMVDGVTGFLYRDPRQDQGADFRRVLARARAGPRPDPRTAADHLARFSRQAYSARVARMAEAARQAL